MGTPRPSTQAEGMELGMLGYSVGVYHGQPVGGGYTGTPFSLMHPGLTLAYTIGTRHEVGRGMGMLPSVLRQLTGIEGRTMPEQEDGSGNGRDPSGLRQDAGRVGKAGMDGIAGQEKEICALRPCVLAGVSGSSLAAAEGRKDTTRGAGVASSCSGRLTFRNCGSDAVAMGEALIPGTCWARGSGCAFVSWPLRSLASAHVAVAASIRAPKRPGLMVQSSRRVPGRRGQRQILDDRANSLQESGPRTHPITSQLQWAAATSKCALTPLGFWSADWPGVVL
jgi:hypothetical protein